MKEKIRLAIGELILLAIYAIILFAVTIGMFFFPMKKAARNKKLPP